MKRFALILLGVVVALELLLRLPPVWSAVDGAIPKGPSPVELLLKEQGGGTDKGFVRDSELGNRPAPSRRETVRTHDFEYLFEVDSAGFPNRGPWPSPADIAVLGNSLVVGQGVGIDSQFSTLLGTRLGTSRVVNFGLGGASPEHEYRIYRRYAAPLHPRLVLAFIWVASDVTNAFNFARWLSGGRDQDFLEYRTTGKAKPSPGPAARAVGLVRSRSRVLRVLSGAGVAVTRARQPYLERVPRADGDTLYLSAKTEQALAQGLNRPGLPELRQVFFQPLVRLRDEVEGQGGRVLVVLIPIKEELYAAAAYPRVLRAARETRVGLDSLGLPTVDLYPPMAEAAGRGEPLFFSRDIHFTVQGNRLVAQALSDSIAARGLPHRWDSASGAPAHAAP
jgi:hypothetical protein